jgi:hypothetical protein
MSTYRVRGIDLDHNGKRFPERTEIELDDQEAAALKRWLEPIPDAPPAAPEPKPTSDEAPGPAPAVKKTKETKGSKP